MSRLFAFLCFIQISFYSLAECTISNAHSLNDPLFITLSTQDHCPSDVRAFIALLKQHGLGIEPAMVANRGRHNPKKGSFSFFEEVRGQLPQLGEPIKDGEFFFGHFTGLNHTIVDLAQEPELDNLLIEAIVWDQGKELFNFYELIGQGNGTRWFYRGDSKTALDDNRFLHLEPLVGQPKFGAGMRCSACHASGGPIMKELAAPHNDWWTNERPLSLEPNRPSATVTSYLNRIRDASTFSGAVEAGMKRLEASDSYQRLKNTRTLQEQVRPIFCATEINIVSDTSELSSSNEFIDLPSAYFLDPTLGSHALSLSKTLYRATLHKKAMRFPETNRQDADHAWLSLVKGRADYIAIDTLIQQNIVSEAWVKAVLAVDYKNPAISLGRCQLLALVPQQYTPDWQEQFIEKLRSSALPLAHDLLNNLLQPPNYEQLADNYFEEIQTILTTRVGVEQLVNKLIIDRKIIKLTDLVKNTLGQILEPRFRVIFPVSLKSL